MIHQKNSNMKEKSTIFIFDANIFLTGIDFNVIEGKIYTTPKIIEEIRVKKYQDKNNIPLFFTHLHSHVLGIREK